LYNPSIPRQLASYSRGSGHNWAQIRVRKEKKAQGFYHLTTWGVVGILLLFGKGRLGRILPCKTSSELKKLFTGHFSVHLSLSEVWRTRPIFLNPKFFILSKRSDTVKFPSFFALVSIAKKLNFPLKPWLTGGKLSFYGSFCTKWGTWVWEIIGPFSILVSCCIIKGIFWCGPIFSSLQQLAQLLPMEENFLLLFRFDNPLDSSVEFMKVKLILKFLTGNIYYDLYLFTKWNLSPTPV